MDSIFCLITRKEKNWQIYVYDKINEYTFEDDNLQVLYHKVYPVINASIKKVVWGIHFIESAFFIIEKNKKLSLKEQVEKKYNYNIEKIKFINVVTKNKERIYNNVFCLNKEAYDEVKEFLKLFNCKLKDEMLFNYQYGLKNCHYEKIVLYKFTDFIIAYTYDKLGLNSICNYDTRLSVDLIDEIKLRTSNLPVTLTCIHEESENVWNHYMDIVKMNI